MPRANKTACSTSRALYQFKIGQGITVRDGKDATIIAHGEMVFEAIEAAKALEAEGINVRVIDMYSIKPIDKDLIIKAVKGDRKYPGL